VPRESPDDPRLAAFAGHTTPSTRFRQRIVARLRHPQPAVVEEPDRGMVTEARSTTPKPPRCFLSSTCRPASSNRAKMYSSVLYAMLTAHRQRREVLAGQRLAEGAQPGVVPRRIGSSSVLYAISTPRIAADSLRTIRRSCWQHCVQSVLYAMIVRRVWAR
jgi:hypothetical protein